MGWDFGGLAQTTSSSPVYSCPEHRSFSWMNFDPMAAKPLDRLPQPTLYTLAGTIPLLGAAQRVLASRVPDSATPLDPVAMARADVDLSVLQIRRNLADLMDCVAAGGYPDADLVLRARRDQVMASERAVRADNHDRANPGSTRRPLLMERVWRDVQTARVHVSSNIEQVLSVVGSFASGARRRRPHLVSVGHTQSSDDRVRSTRDTCHR